jgi:hypothetical protein
MRCFLLLLEAVPEFRCEYSLFEVEWFSGVMHKGCFGLEGLGEPMEGRSERRQELELVLIAQGNNHNVP